jgi:hypothetical protein|nr:MAG TPA: hypothetical protein [Caudoviricetes sp.]
MSNKKEIGKIIITVHEIDIGYEVSTKFSNGICVDISGVRALIRTLRNIEKTIAKQVFSSMVNEDDDLVKSIFLDN